MDQPKVATNQPKAAINRPNDRNYVSDCGPFLSFLFPIKICSLLQDHSRKDYCYIKTPIPNLFRACRATARRCSRCCPTTSTTGPCQRASRRPSTTTASGMSVANSSFFEIYFCFIFYSGVTLILCLYNIGGKRGISTFTVTAKSRTCVHRSAGYFSSWRRAEAAAVVAAAIYRRPMSLIQATSMSTVRRRRGRRAASASSAVRATCPSPARCSAAAAAWMTWKKTAAAATRTNWMDLR